MKPLYEKQTFKLIIKEYCLRTKDGTSAAETGVKYEEGEAPAENNLISKKVPFFKKCGVIEGLVLGRIAQLNRAKYYS